MPVNPTATSKAKDPERPEMSAHHAYLRTFVILSAVLFLAEFGVMSMLPFFPTSKPWVHDSTDATLMVVLAFPALYSLVLRPMHDHIRERRRIELELHRHREQLEVIVEQRTEELTQRNQQLQEEIEERKRAEAQLAWQASFPKLNPLPIVEVDWAGRVYFINPAAQRLFPDLQEKQLDHPWLADWAAMAAQLQKGGTQPAVREVAVGESLYHQTLHQIAQTNRIRIYGWDVTEQKGMERALRQSEEFNRSIIESSSDCINVVDPKGQLQYMNPGGQKLLGITEISSYLGLSYEEFWSDSDKASVREALATALAGKMGQFTGFSPTRDGEPKWWDVVVSPILNPDGRVVRLLVMSRDITARRQMEEALLRTNELLEERVAQRTAQLQAASLYARSLIEASLDPLVTISSDGKIMDVNRATEEVTGVPREHLIGSSFTDYFTQPQTANLGFQKVLAEGQVRDFPLTIRHTSGRTTEVLYHATVYRDETGEVQGMFAAARDTTERKRLQRQILDASESERQRIGQDLHDSMGGRLAGTALMSKALAQSLAAKGLPEAALAEEIVQCVNEAISETRSVARGLCPVEVGEFGLISGLREFAADTQKMFGVQCLFRTSGDPVVPNESGASHLFRIAQEAVNNAIRHGKAREITITLTQAADRLCLEIRDNGTGMISNGNAGTGLGLRTMRYRTELIRGQFEVKPADAGGTVVTCSVPVQSLEA